MKTIPFNYDLWKAGKGKVVYRDGTEPINLMVVGDSIVSVHKGVNTALWHKLNGESLAFGDASHLFDLLLQIEPTYIKLEQKDWIGEWWVRLRSDSDRYDLFHSNTWYAVNMVSEDGSFYVQIRMAWILPELAMAICERTNAERMSDPSIPEDQKWVACRKEAV